jgi:hypothetical protein
MKLKTVLKDARESIAGVKSAHAVGKADWMITGEQAQNEALERQRLLSDRRRPPELWFKDGEEKTIRFRTADPIACVFRYTVQVNGRWTKFTAPADGEVDLFRDELGLRPSFCALYEVVDMAGYTDRDGKKHNNITRFFVAGSRNFEQLRKLSEKRGPLTKYDVCIARSGSGTQTTYTFIPESPTPMSDKVKQAESIRAKVQEFYAPPTEKEQRMLVRALTKGRSSDEDEDEDREHRPF